MTSLDSEATSPCDGLTKACTRPSALAKNDPFALGKSDPHEEHDLPTGKERASPQGHASFSRNPFILPEPVCLPGGPKRLLAPFASRQTAPPGRPGWVTLGEQTRVISRERRRPAAANAAAAGDAQLVSQALAGVD